MVWQRRLCRPFFCTAAIRNTYFAISIIFVVFPVFIRKKYYLCNKITLISNRDGLERLK